MDRMASRSRHVLVVASEAALLDRVAPMLRRTEFEVHTVDDTPFVLDLVTGTPFELLLVSFPPAAVSTADLVATVRHADSPCRRAGLVLLANEDRLEMASRWVDRGANRVVSTAWSDARVWRAIGDLLDVAPRIDLRVLVEVEVEMAHGGRTELVRSHNVSAAGMLLTGDVQLPPGTPFEFAFCLPHQTELLRGRAEVVRRTDPEREGVAGLGARILSWRGDAEARFQDYLRRHRQ